MLMKYSSHASHHRDYFKPGKRSDGGPKCVRRYKLYVQWTGPFTMYPWVFSQLNEIKWYSWLVAFRINVDLAIFQPYLVLEAGDKPISENSSGEAGNRNAVLLLRKPRA